MRDERTTRPTLWRVILFGCLAVALAGSSRAAAQDPKFPYPITILPGFQSTISAQEAATLALEAVTVPLLVGPSGPKGRLAVGPPLPSILELVGCRGADLPTIDSRVSPVPDPYVWYVHVRGTFVLPHLDRMDDQDGFVLIDVRSGLVFRKGVFLDPGRLRQSR